MTEVVPGLWRHRTWVCFHVYIVRGQPMGLLEHFLAVKIRTTSERSREVEDAAGHVLGTEYAGQQQGSLASFPTVHNIHLGT